MASKISLIFLAVVVVLHMTEATKFRREAPSEKPTEKNAAQAIDEAFSSFKTGVNDFVKKIEDNEFVQNLSKSFKDFGDSVQQKGEELVNKLKSEGKKVPPPAA
ncbi:hypothetical protein JTB14_017841 [Gonioctena quinquepunctata]|nr:hypothetical protein JTB14_017841 [Gonioctena quinquepunctata]